MSGRGFIISLAANFLVAGVVAFLAGPNVAYICFAIGLGLLAVAYFWQKKKDPQAPPGGNPAVPGTAPISVHLSNIGNPIVTQEQTKSDIVPPPAPPPRPEAKIDYVDADNIFVSEANGIFYKTPPESGDYQVSIICFRNDASTQNVAHPYAKAHLIYRDSNGNEITDLPSAIWLNESGEHVKFDAGTKRCLIALLLGRNGQLVKLWQETHPAGVGIRVMDVSEIQEEEMLKEVASIEVQLLAGHYQGKCLTRKFLDITEPRHAGLPKLFLRRD